MPMAMQRRVALSYGDAVGRVREALRAEGFGVLTEIDVKRTFAEKLNADFRDYVIIGACNPPLALRALQGDLEIGVLLPCNVVVYADGDGSVVAMFDPEVGMAMVDSPEVAAVAREARERLTRALAAV